MLIDSYWNPEMQVNATTSIQPAGKDQSEYAIQNVEPDTNQWLCC